MVIGIMAKHRNSNSGNNINNNIKMIEKSAKIYKWCWKCSGKLEEPSINPFCCWECQQDYYQEQAKELNTCFREWAGRD